MPANYTDRYGNSHTVEITVPVAIGLRDECGVDLLQCLVDRDAMSSLNNTIQKLAADPVQIISWLTVIEDIPESGAEDFGRSFDGETLQQAAGAVIESIVNFTPEPQRTILRRLMERTTEAWKTGRVTATAAAMQAVEDLDYTWLESASPIRGSGSKESLESSDQMATG